MRDEEREIEREKVGVETEIGKAIVSNINGSHTVRLSLPPPPSLSLSLCLYPIQLLCRDVALYS